MMGRSPIVGGVMKNAIHPRIKGPSGGKQYICASCHSTFMQKHVQVDHIKPVVPVDRTIHDMSYDEIVTAVLCLVDGKPDPSLLQVLCKPCHKKKTADERLQKKRIKEKSETPIINVDTGEVFSCIRLAKESVHAKSHSGILSCCKGKQGRSCGFMWKYHNEGR